MIAKTIYLAKSPGISESISNSDVIAICSLIVAALALGFSIAFAEVQRRHNVRVAKPHMDIDLGTAAHVMRLKNHGPGVARLLAFSATAGGREFDLLTRKDVEAFSLFLGEGLGRPGRIAGQVHAIGAYLAPGYSSNILSIQESLSLQDQVRLRRKLVSTSFRISVSSIYDKIYTDVHPPIENEDE